ncbi:zinc finger protein 888-like [Cydia splendana]|uniref:zinc finger protein 888-like n=1 Tax=Cydia splendana TaxID=1100963 RepID=UPI00300D4FCB
MEASAGGGGGGARIKQEPGGAAEPADREQSFVKLVKIKTKAHFTHAVAAITVKGPSPYRAASYRTLGRAAAARNGYRAAVRQLDHWRASHAPRIEPFIVGISTRGKGMFARSWDGCSTSQHLVDYIMHYVLVTVKEEAEFVDEDGCGVSEAAMLAGLYDEHVVKEELVLGPECPHRPIVASALVSSAVESGPEGRPNVITIYHCHRCGKRYRNRPAKEEQGVRNLRTDEMIHTRDDLFKCNYCDYKCKEKTLLQPHQMTHTGVKPFICKHCVCKGNAVSNHTEVKPIHCSDCDYKCKIPAELRRHQMTHTGEKPFQCRYCDYRCRHRGHLRSHEMIHTGDKPYKCKNCDYKCTKTTDLRRHQMKHTGERPFDCRNCDSKFTSKRNLRRHQSVHTGENTFQCRYCDYRCRHRGHFRLHEMKHTGDETNP